MTAIAIFVKTPGLSPIKTRLAQTIGQTQAEAWHHQAALAVAEVAHQVSIGPVYLAVAEPEAHNSPIWAEFSRLAQPPGSLGIRMARIHTELILRHGSAVLLGADTPQIEADDLKKAHAWLASPQARQVIGPARDGGFWLYGSNRSIDEDRWTSVEYSQKDTRTRFLKAMQAQGALLRLGEKTDLDHAEEMAQVQQELSELSQATAKQSALLAWLKTQQE